ncbi:MAG: alpha/beta hydrolase [Proteobacteria bacterium]|nr:alpha/beta hydrolase [Pseudomonadota bacterium]
MKRPSVRQVQAAAAVVAVLALAAVASGAALMSRTPGSQPGRLVTLPDHRKLNFRCSGEGSPTVLLEAGFGASSTAWYKVAPLVAAVTRVCAYDRAGYGFSDPGPIPRDGAAIARDLDAGLTAAHIDGPFVVVGHSAGGLYARLFAARRRDQVVGLVFVDSSVEHQTQRLQALYGPNVAGLESMQRRVLECQQLTSGGHRTADDPALKDCVSPKDDAHQRQIATRPETWRAQVSELDNLFTSTSDEVDRIGPLLQDIPAVVLTAGDADGPGVPPNGPWQAFHAQLAASFHKSERKVVKSSHLMMLDRPEVVADAAVGLVKAARKP